MMLFYLMLGLAPHGLDLGFLGLGFGLGPHLLKRLIRRTLNDLALSILPINNIFLILIKWSLI